MGIAEPADPLTVSTTGTGADCASNSMGSATANPSGGTAPYDYLWSNGQTSQTITGLEAGGYTVIVTDANSCTATGFYVVTDATSIEAFISAKENVSCFGGNDGSATVNGAGGVAPYTYLWDDPLAQTTATASGLTAGLYTVTVTDNSGGANCEVTVSVMIGEPSPLSAFITMKEHVDCNGGSTGMAMVSAAGGTPFLSGAAYEYDWDNDATGDFDDPAMVIGLAAGTYNVVVRDAEGCTATASVTINGPTVALTIDAITPSSPSCFGGNDGSIELEVSGGTPPYSYNWNNGAQDVEDPNGLTAGDYDVTVTDANGCMVEGSVTIVNPMVLTVDIDLPTDVTCNGDNDGELTASASGGTGTISYNWSNGDDDDTAEGLTAGSYDVTVTDENGCTAVDSEVVSEPDPILITLDNKMDNSCSGDPDDGFIEITVSGGTPNYSFDWDNGAPDVEDPSGLAGGNYTVTVEDANGCTSSLFVMLMEPTEMVGDIVATTNVSCNGLTDGTAQVDVSGGTPPYEYAWSGSLSNTAIATGLSAGSHEVTVTDDNDCFIVIPFNITEPNALEIMVSVLNDVSCNGENDGVATVSNIMGGTPPYTYLWSNGENTQTAFNLTAGTHSVTVTDANGCTDVETTEVIDEPAQLDLIMNGTDALCAGDMNGTTTATPSGGTGPYDFVWSTGETDSDPVSSTINDLPTGSYTVTVTDAEGCSIVRGVVIGDPPALTFHVTTVTDNECNGDMEGSVELSISGGSSPYELISVSGPTAVATPQALVSGNTISGLAAGFYVFTVEDDNGCQITTSATVHEPTDLLAEIIHSENVSCNGLMDGTATVNATGGTTPYSYLWSANAGSQMNATATGLGADNYSVTITDDNDCQVVVNVTINEPSALTANINASTDVSCFGGEDGTATVTPSGGTPPYTYEWDNGETNITALHLNAGTHSVTVTDANNCSVSTTVVIGQSTPLDADIDVTNADCGGNNTGSATATPSGGMPNYTFEWSNGQVFNNMPSSTATGLSAGGYTVTITDAKGCTLVKAFTIDDPSDLGGTIMSQTDPTCNGGNDGMAMVTGSGGSGVYSYSWSSGTPSNGGQNVNDLSAGTHKVTITDTNNPTCSFVVTFTLGEPTPVDAELIISTDETCPDENDGTATVNATGGTPPYEYLWSNTDATATATNLMAGVSYSVSVTDAEDCEFVLNGIQIGQPTALSIDGAVPTMPLCNGGNDGSIELTVSGGTPPYSFDWSNGAQDVEDPNGLVAGTYGVVVTDANGCTATMNGIVVGEPAALDFTVSVDNNVSCHGGNNGRASISNITGGTPGVSGYNIAWSNGDNGTMATNLSAGGYSVTVTDENGCTLEKSVTITEPEDLVISLEDKSDVTCFGGNDGSIDVSVSGGIAPLTYAWSGPGGYTANTADISGLEAGNYTLTASYMSNGVTCSTSMLVMIMEPTELIAGIVDNISVTCNGGDDGSAIVNATGGTTPYEYLWSDPNGQTTAMATGLSAGNYTVTVTDENDCSVEVNVEITEPSAVTAAINSSSDVSCNGGEDGTATVTPGGGTPPYTYEWDNGETNVTALHLDAGTHTVTVTDANNCSETATVDIDEPANGLSAEITTVPADCGGNATGSATATPSNGTPPYTFNWSNGLTETDMVSSTATGLSAGGYSVTITDDNGCTLVKSFTISDPSDLGGFIMAQTDPTCNGYSDGIAMVVATGGSGNYSYAWSAGTPPLDEASVSGLAAGTHKVTITDTDNPNCTFVVSLTLGEPTPLIGEVIATTDETCPANNDGTATVNATGGTPPYTYAWSNGDATALATNLMNGVNYSVVITDANGCTYEILGIQVDEPTALSIDAIGTTMPLCNGGNDGSIEMDVSGGTAPYLYDWGIVVAGSEPQDVEDPNGLEAGTYRVTVTDANGCQIISGNVVVNEPSALSLTPSVDNNVSCHGGDNGTASISASGGTPGVSGYNYAWSNGDNGTTATNLTAGGYSVTVTDENGCIAVASVTITEPADLVISLLDKEDVSCEGGADGAIDVSVSGGIAPLTYSWSGPNAFSANTPDISGLEAGNYILTVSYIANNVTCSTSMLVMIMEPTELIAGIVDVNHVNCNMGTDGSATVNATGGTTPYSYQWSANASGQTSATATSLGAGDYSVIVTDANDCQVEVNVTITEPTPVDAIAAQVSAVNCIGGNDGTASVTPSGGTPPYTFEWDNGETNIIAQHLTAGIHSVTVTDANNCMTIDMVTISGPNSGLSADLVVMDADCGGNATGKATATADGGTAPYDFDWSNGQSFDNMTSSMAINLSAGGYDVTITDANGCTLIKSFTINDPSDLNGVISAQEDPLCNGDSNGSATVTAFGGSGSYTYNWSAGTPSPGGQSVTGLPAGTHSVTITDANNPTCEFVVTFTLDEPTLLIADIVNSTDISCFGENDGTATVNATGGTTNYTYLWSASAGGQTGSTATNLPPGNHSVIVTDDNGCQTSASVHIDEPALLQLMEESHVDVSCKDGQDGAIYVLTMGGTGPYNYDWSGTAPVPVDNAEDALNIGAGSYILKVTDANGCEATLGPIEIEEPSRLTVNIDNVVHANCADGDDGSAEAIASGGTPGYTYAWSNGHVGAVVSNLAAGGYTVTVTDDNGCTAEASVNILDPNELVLKINDIEDVSCNGESDGTVTVSVIGGTGPYTFTGPLLKTGPTTAVANGLAAGTYLFMVTDANGCVAMATATVDEPTLLIAEMISHTDISCYDANDGTATVNATGGTTPYSYAWDNGANTATAVGLTPGLHTVQVTDANGCTANAVVVIDEPNQLMLIESSTQDVSCNGGSDGYIDVITMGGTGPFTYQWIGSEPIPVDDAEDAQNITAGTYHLKVTDANGCEFLLGPIDINEPTPLLVEISDVEHADCADGENGSATAEASGGNGGYSYAWSNGDFGPTASDLPSGGYTVTVTDSKGCTAEVSVTISDPNELILKIKDITDVTCNGESDGSVSVSVVGGTGPYDFMTPLTLTDPDEATASGLATGTYLLMVTDANGCVAMATATVDEPTVLIADMIAHTDVTCNGENDGTAMVNATGGTTPYSYEWSASAGGQTTSLATNLPPGIHTVTVTDANDCETTATVVIEEPDLLQLMHESTIDVSCNGGSDGYIFVLTMGGTGPFNYDWSGTSPVPIDNGEDAQNISAGTYLLKVTDANGCEVTLGPIEVEEPPLLTVDITNVEDADCAGNETGSASAEASGGTPGYTYEWSNGQFGPDATGLAAGGYSVTVTDDKGCTAEASVFISDPAGLVLKIEDITDVSCYGEDDGSVDVSVIGGAMPYTFTLPLVATGPNTATASGLVAGTYVFMVTDDNGCVAMATATVDEPTLLIAEIIDHTDISCEDEEDGSATVNATGGTTPYTYLWDNGETTAIALNLDEGVHTVIVTDANGCEATAEVLIEEPDELRLNLSDVIDVSCYGGSDGYIFVSLNGGTGPFTYKWSGTDPDPIDDAQDAQHIGAGIYSVRVIDANGCEAYLGPIEVEEPPLLTVSITDVEDADCADNETGSATAAGNGGTGNYSYEWSNGQFGPTATGLHAGGYTVTITDENGCTAQTSVSITDPNELVLKIEDIEDVRWQWL